MPADFGEQSQKSSTASKILTRAAQIRGELDGASSSNAGPVSAGSSSSNWFRSFTCFAGNTDGEQASIDAAGKFNFS